MYFIDQPLLMMAGIIANTSYMTKQCHTKATSMEWIELFLISGATHIKTCYVLEYVNPEVNKLTFFCKTYKINQI